MTESEYIRASNCTALRIARLCVSEAMFDDEREEQRQTVAKMLNDLWISEVKTYESEK